MRRKLCHILLSFLVLFARGFVAEAEILSLQENLHLFDTPICLTVNEVYLSMDSEPFLKDGKTYVPIRFVSQALGAEVAWDARFRCALIRQEDQILEMYADSGVAIVNGVPIAENIGLYLVNDRLYVPIRFVAEHLNCRVLWENETYTVKVVKEGITVPEELVGERGFRDDEIYWLSKIIHAESRGEPMEGKIAVGNVILNRVKSEAFPDTIYSVIFDREFGVQFSPVLDGSVYFEPFGDSVIAAKRALSGENPIGDCLYFLNPQRATNFWIVQHRTYQRTIANHDFYL